GEAVHTVRMDLTVVTVLFLLTAVLVAIAILLAVALPNLRRREDHDDGTGSGEDRRHSSRTPRAPSPVPEGPRPGLRPAPPRAGRRSGQRRTSRRLAQSSPHHRFPRPRRRLVDTESLAPTVGSAAGLAALATGGCAYARRRANKPSDR